MAKKNCQIGSSSLQNLYEVWASIKQIKCTCVSIFQKKDYSYASGHL